jgi:hypothetical protein
MDLQAFDVAADDVSGHLTPTVHGFAATELYAMLQMKTQGISQAALREIEEAIRQRQAADLKSLTP